MANLSHWDLADTFSLRDAAFLMMGVDPSGPEVDKYSARHISERLETAYAGAIRRAEFEGFVEPCFSFDAPEPENYMPEGAVLRSVELWERIDSFREHGDAPTFTGWLSYGNHSHHGQRFSRREIARWLRENSMKSVYHFDLQSICIPTDQGNISDAHQTEKSISSRERNTLLTIIAALCKEAKIDYKAHAKSAKIIRGTMAEMGVDVGETTIEGHLKKIANALESRAR